MAAEASARAAAAEAIAADCKLNNERALNPQYDPATGALTVGNNLPTDVYLAASIPTRNEVTPEMAAKVARLWPVVLQYMFLVSIDPVREAELRNNMGLLTQFIRHVVGVDGRSTLPLGSTLNGRHKPHNDLPGSRMTLGQLGCFLSHQTCLELQVKLQIPFATILEDDTDLVPSLAIWASLHTGLRQLEDANKMNAWDILYIGRTGCNTRTLRRITDNVVEVGKTWGAFAYVVKLDAARRLLALAAEGFSDPWDVFLSDDAQRLGGGRFVRYAITPIPLFVRADVESTTMCQPDEQEYNDRLLAERFAQSVAAEARARKFPQLPIPLPPAAPPT